MGVGSLALPKKKTFAFLTFNFHFRPITLYNMSISSKNQASWSETVAPEKRDATHVEYMEMGGNNKLETSSNESMALESNGYDKAASNRLVRKIDWALLPLLALLYLLSFLDRTNIGESFFHLFLPLTLY